MEGGRGGRRQGEIIPSHSNRRTDADGRTRSIALSRAPLAVRPIVMDFRHENMLISVRSEPGTGEAACLAMNVKWKLPPSILHSSFFPSIAVSEMPKDHFFCFADCANAERERRTRLTLFFLRRRSRGKPREQKSCRPARYKWLATICQSGGWLTKLLLPPPLNTHRQAVICN